MTLKGIDPAVEQLRVDFIGASVSNQMQSQAFTGTALALLGIALYVAWAFRRVSYPVTSWNTGRVLSSLWRTISLSRPVFSVSWGTSLVSKSGAVYRGTSHYPRLLGQ